MRPVRALSESQNECSKPSPQGLKPPESEATIVGAKAPTP